MGHFLNWLNYLRTAEKTSIIKDNVRKIHYTFPDGNQMAEEYSMDTGVVLRRMWKKKKELRGEPSWTVELGEVLPDFGINDGNFVMKESSTAVRLSTVD